MLFNRSRRYSPASLGWTTVVVAMSTWSTSEAEGSFGAQSLKHRLTWSQCQFHLEIKRTELIAIFGRRIFFNPQVKTGVNWPTHRCRPGYRQERKTMIISVLTQAFDKMPSPPPSRPSFDRVWMTKAEYMDYAFFELLMYPENAKDYWCWGRNIKDIM